MGMWKTQFFMRAQYSFNILMLQIGALETVIVVPNLSRVGSVRATLTLSLLTQVVKAAGLVFHRVTSLCQPSSHQNSSGTGPCLLN